MQPFIFIASILYVNCLETYLVLLNLTFFIARKKERQGQDEEEKRE